MSSISLAPAPVLSTIFCRRCFAIPRAAGVHVDVYPKGFPSFRRLVHDSTSAWSFTSFSLPFAAFFRRFAVAGLKKNRTMNNIRPCAINRSVLGAAFDNFFFYTKNNTKSRTHASRIGTTRASPAGNICNKSHRGGRAAMIEPFSSPDRFTLFLTFLAADLCARRKRGAALCPGPTEGANPVYARAVLRSIGHAFVENPITFGPCEEHPDRRRKPRRRIRGVFG